MAGPMDVAVPSAVETAVVAATDRFGGLDVLVNNAGIHLQHAQLPFTLEALPRWREVLDVNVLGVLACSARRRRVHEEPF